MIRDLNVAIIGCGYWGPNLVRNFMSLPDCQVKAVCDVNRNRLAHMKQLYGDLRTTVDFNEIISDPGIDAVAIALPVHLHHRFAKQSLLTGKHTFIEKPMAGSTRECNDLIYFAEKRNLTLMVGHTFIYSAAVKKIKDLIKSNYLGEILYISSQRLNLGLFQKDINVTWDLAPHDISIINYLLEQGPTFVNCQGKAHVNPAIEDVTNLSLDFASGCFATIYNSWLDPNKIRKMTVVGSKKMLVYDDTEPLEKIKIYDKRVEKPPHYDTFAEFQYSYHYGDVVTPYLKQVEPLKVQCQHFVDCIKTGATPKSSAKDGRRVVQVLEAASRSLERGGAKVSVKSDDNGRRNGDKDGNGNETSLQNLESIGL